LIPFKIPEIQSVECKEIGPVSSIDCTYAIKTNVGDSVNVVVHLERRPGRRFVSEVVEIHGYDPDRDEYNYGFIFDSHKELV
jgi:hypothetical protein